MSNFKIGDTVYVPLELPDNSELQIYLESKILNIDDENATVELSQELLDQAITQLNLSNTIDQIITIPITSIKTEEEVAKIQEGNNSEENELEEDNDTIQMDEGVIQSHIGTEEGDPVETNVVDNADTEGNKQVEELHQEAFTGEDSEKGKQMKSHPALFDDLDSVDGLSLDKSVNSDKDSVNSTSSKASSILKNSEKDSESSSASVNTHSSSVSSNNKDVNLAPRFLDEDDDFDEEEFELQITEKMPEYARVYDDRDALMADLLKDLMSKIPPTIQSKPAILNKFKRKATKYLDSIDYAKKLTKRDPNTLSIIYEIAENDFNNSRIIPIVKTKSIKYIGTEDDENDSDNDDDYRNDEDSDYVIKKKLKKIDGVIWPPKEELELNKKYYEGKLEGSSENFHDAYFDTHYDMTKPYSNIGINDGYNIEVEKDISVLNFNEYKTNKWSLLRMKGPNYRQIEISDRQDPDIIREVMPVKYISGDNISIVGYLVLPNNDSKINEYLDGKPIKFTKFGEKCVIKKIVTGKKTTIFTSTNHGLFDKGESIIIRNNENNPSLDGFYVNLQLSRKLGRYANYPKFKVISDNQIELDVDTSKTSMNKHNGSLLCKLSINAEINEINNLDERLWSEDKTAHMIKTPQIFLFNDLKVDNTKLVDLIKLCFPLTVDETITNEIVNKLSDDKLLTVDTMLEILDKYNIKINELSASGFRIFSQIFDDTKKKLEKVQEEKKDKLSELLQKAQKQIASLEDNFNYIDSQSINDSKLENYTPYTDLAGPRDSVFNRFLWLNNQEDRGEIFYLTKKYAYYQKMIDYYSSKLGDIQKEIPSLDNNIQNLDQEIKELDSSEECSALGIVKIYENLTELDKDNDREDVMQDIYTDRRVNDGQYALVKDRQLIFVRNGNNSWDKYKNVNDFREECEKHKEIDLDLEITAEDSECSFDMERGCIDKKILNKLDLIRALKMKQDMLSKDIEMVENSTKYYEQIEEDISKLNKHLLNLQNLKKIKRNKKIQAKKHPKVKVISTKKETDKYEKILSKFKPDPEVQQAVKDYIQDFEMDTLNKGIDASMLDVYQGFTEDGKLKFDYVPMPEGEREVPIEDSSEQKEPIKCKSKYFNDPKSQKVCLFLEKLLEKINVFVSKSIIEKCVLLTRTLSQKNPSFSKWFAVVKKQQKKLEAEKAQLKYDTWIHTKTLAIASSLLLIYIQLEWPKIKTPGSKTGCTFTSFFNLEGVSFISCVCAKHGLFTFIPEDGSKTQIIKGPDILKYITDEYKEISKTEEFVSLLENRERLAQEEEDKQKISQVSSKPEWKIIPQTLGETLQNIDEQLKSNNTNKSLISQNYKNLKQRSEYVSDTFIKLLFEEIGKSEADIKYCYNSVWSEKNTGICNTGCCVHNLNESYYFKLGQLNKNIKSLDAEDHTFSLMIEEKKLLLNRGSITKNYYSKSADIPATTYSTDISQDFINKKFKYYDINGNKYIFNRFGRCIITGKKEFEIQSGQSLEEYNGLLYNISKNSHLKYEEYEKQDVSDSVYSVLVNESKKIEDKIADIVVFISQNLETDKDSKKITSILTNLNELKYYNEKIENLQQGDKKKLISLFNEKNTTIIRNIKNYIVSFVRNKIAKIKHISQIKTTKTFFRESSLGEKNLADCWKEEKLVLGKQVVLDKNVNDLIDKYISQDDTRLTEEYLLKEKYEDNKKLIEVLSKFKPKHSNEFIEDLVGSSDIYKCKSVKEDEVPEIIHQSKRNLNEVYDILNYILLDDLFSLTTLTKDESLNLDIADLIKNIIFEINNHHELLNFTNEESYKEFHKAKHNLFEEKQQKIIYQQEKELLREVRKYKLHKLINVEKLESDAQELDFELEGEQIMPELGDDDGENHPESYIGDNMDDGEDMNAFDNLGEHGYGDYDNADE